MPRNPLFLSALAVLAGLAIIQPGCDWPVVEITTNIDTPTTWSGNRVYLIKKKDFYVNAELTIEPGAIIKFHPTAGPTLALGQGGRIVARGTHGARIVFTSYRDDNWGGDTNQDAAATGPAARDWGNVDTNGESGSVFEYCVFSYGGKGSHTETLRVSAGSQAAIRHCEFSYNDGSKDSSAALEARGAAAGTVIEDNVFFGNVQPLAINTALSLDDSNRFRSAVDPSLTNQRNGIVVWSPHHITGSTVWRETEVAFVIGGGFWVNSGSTLTVGDGVVLKFTANSMLTLENGPPALVNHNGAGVWFTSWRDDAHAGDTNGDGSATQPAAGDWGGIHDDSRSRNVTWPNVRFGSN